MTSDGPCVHTPIRIVDKPWGREIWFANNEMYCGKILEIEPQKNSSLHYHRVKDETLYVMSGTLQFTCLKTDDGIADTQQIEEGNCVRIKPGQPHRLAATNEKVVLCEVSTHHRDSDSFRISR